jgi:uncharacterized protein (TIGR03435 family)
MLAIAAATIGSRAQPSPSPAFEVASVRRTPPASLGNTSVGPWGTATYTITNAGLYLLVEQAYGISEGQISGIDKLGSEHYDISAKAEEGVKLTPELLRPRLQRLLAERFKLEVHRDSKDVDGYALVVAKGGPKLKPAGKGTGGNSVYPGGLRMINAPVSAFALLLVRPAGRPVVDKTGITGNYDFTLTYAKEGDTGSSLPNFFTALQEKLGLKLEPAKVREELVVIDRVEKIPTEN